METTDNITAKRLHYEELTREMNAELREAHRRRMAGIDRLNLDIMNDQAHDERIRRYRCHRTPRY